MVRSRKSYRPSNSVGKYWSAEEDMSLADKVALLPDKEREQALAELDMEKLQHDFSFWGRPSQLDALESTAHIVCALSGRGWGKTRLLAEAMQRKAMEKPGCRMALVGRSTSDVRDILILGESGVMTVVNPADRPEYKPSVRRLVWKNGSEAMTFTADIPDQLRGVQFDFGFADELGSWRVKATNGGMVNAWQNLQIATRLGENPQIFVATTPRRVPMILDVVQQADEHPEKVYLVRGSTFANRALGASYKDAVTGLYEGTTLGQQELEGELLSDVEGALLNMSDIQDNKLLELDKDDTDGDELNDIPPSYFWEAFPHRIIGVDPSVSAQPNDECGIVACAASGERKMYKRQGYVLEDASILGTPEEWAKVVVAMARKYRAVVVAEDNQGGEMVKMVIQAQDPRVPVTLVRSAAGKLARAEPVAMAYQQGRVHHTDDFNMLEDQLTSWAPDTGQKSPDRMDACLAADTLVKMGDGTEKRIDQVQIGEYVATRVGPRKVLAAEMTQASASVYTLTSSAGHRLVGTGNHPVWSESRNDFVAMDALVNDIIVTCQTTNKISRLRSSTEGFFTKEIPTLNNALTEFTTERVEEATAGFYTVTSTKTLSVRSLLATTFITSTKILSTMIQRILKLLPRLRTGKSTMNTTKHDARTWWKSQAPLQQSGTEQLLDESSFDKQLTPCGTNASTRLVSATGAACRTSVEALGTRTRSATGPVDHAGTNLRFRPSREHAVNAPALSTSEMIFRDKSAQADAKIFVVGVKAETQKIPVWNLEVEDAHEYFANGILVHNCIHALTALLVVKPKKGLGQISIGANSSGRHLGSIRDHDPLTPMIPGAVGGDNRRAMLHRLARVEGVNIEEYLGNDEDEMDEGELVTPEMVRRIRRTNRLQVGPTRNHGPEATLFGAPNQYRRF